MQKITSVNRQKLSSLNPLQLDAKAVVRRQFGFIQGSHAGAHSTVGAREYSGISVDEKRAGSGIATAFWELDDMRLAILLAAGVAAACGGAQRVDLLV
jgi:hypothetical protein